MNNGLSKTYAATDSEMGKWCSNQFNIDKETGKPTDRKVFKFPNTATYITVRPGLRWSVGFYSVTTLPEGKLVVISDRFQTRYYWLTKNPTRETFLVDFPSRSFEEAWVNLFKGLLLKDGVASTRFYNEIYILFLRHFQEENKEQVITIEGVWKKLAFVASISWEPSSPGKLDISSTYDSVKSRSVPFAFHPIEAVHRVSRK